MNFGSLIDANHPSVWIWEVITSTWYGGYASFKGKFCSSKQDSTYLNFIKNKIILGTWDDHDFGVNDGGQEYLFKKRKSKLLIW
jgi:alkaline phosphatase D